ncbi:MAG: cell division protein FtsX [Flavobacteriaceae bacterium]|nr:MAG: cell division protein FtsX [Flavobacteriaceae bacterium]
MIKNNLKIAWRSLKKQPFFTFLNTFGLAIGMAGGLLISLYIYDELNYDTMFPDADRIHRLNVDIKFGGEAQEFAVLTAPMAEAVESDIPMVEMTTRFRTQGGVLIKKSGTELNVKEQASTYVDDTFFDMFGIELLEGDIKTALKDPNTLLLTKTAAEKHFSTPNALGQSMVLDNDEVYTVTGILEDFPHNSFLRDQTIFMAMRGYEDAWVPNWGSNNFQTFVKLIPGATIEDFQAPLQAIVGSHVIPGVQEFFPGITEAQFIASGSYMNFSTVALTDIHLSENRTAEISQNNSMQNVYIMSFIALFLIVLASINFMNLSTAHSLKRAKEVGIRKTLGSNKMALVRQFLTESGLITFLSLVLAIILAAIALPYYNDLSGKTLSIPYANPFFWLILLASTAFLGLFSGSYPAFFMSSFIPIKVLKGSGEGSIGGGKIRNSLVVFQFAISVFLIVSTLVVYQQLQYIQNKDLGFSKDQMLVVNDVYGVGDQIQSFKQQVQQLGSVQGTTLSSYFPTPSSRSDSGFFQEGSTNQEDAVQMQTWRVDHDYINTIGLEIIAGRDFDRQFSTDSTAIIINETALAVMGISAEEALGSRWSSAIGEENPEMSTIIGVVKNFHYSSLKDDIGALNLYIGDFAGSMAVKINGGNITNSLSQIEGVWNKVAPGQPFNYYFMDESFNNTYQSERRLGTIFIIFTILSILIACLGLFGLAAFNAEKRTKEIGIRKVLGASVGQISYRLSYDFLKLVGIAILVSLPIGWFAMNKWLEDFSYRIEIPWWVFALAAFLAVGISILTVSYQSIKAAIVNPVKSLRAE